MHQEKRMRTLFLMSKGSASDIASLYPPVKTGGFIAPSSYPFTLRARPFSYAFLLMPTQRKRARRSSYEAGSPGS